jgi:alpha-L-fucosidase
MLRARGIGNYGDYYTPEGFVPSSHPTTNMPWFVIYPLGTSFSYETDSTKYKGTAWIVQNLIDISAKGGNFMVGVGPDANGRFHPEALCQLMQAGRWLKVNGEGIYATRPREGALWAEGSNLRFTRTKDGGAMYCFALEWPGRTLTIQSLQRQAIHKVELLGYRERLAFRWDPARGLIVTIPEGLQPPQSRPAEHAWGFKISHSS